MRAEKDIRAAIGTAITNALASLTPMPVIIPRNLLGRIREGHYTELLDAFNKVHGWMITPYADAPSGKGEKLKRHTEYSIRYLVWQFHEYRTGSDESNSEDDASVERDTVKSLFIPTATSVCGIVAGCGPLEFSQAFYPGTLSIDLIPIGDRMCHIAQGTLTVDDIIP